MSVRPPAAYAAVDLGASSGRVMLGFVEAGAGSGAGAEGERQVRMTEVHRFANGPHPESLAPGATLRWDVDRLFDETLAGLAAAVRVAAEHGRELAGIGVDSWGVDYALLPPGGAGAGSPAASADPQAQAASADSRPIPPVDHYRGADPAGPAEAESVVTAARSYTLSGIPPQPINTSYRLRAAVRAARAAEPDRAEDGRAESDPAEPDYAESDRAESGSTESGHAESGHAESDRAEPDRAEPDYAESDPAEPDYAESDPAEPDYAESDRAESGSTESGHAESGHAESDRAEPDRAEPDYAESDPAEPDYAEPDPAESDPTEPDSAEPGGTVLLVPDLWVHLLSGATSAERTIASTTQLLDAQTGDWSAELVDALGLGSFTLPGTVAPGARAGVTLPWVTERIGAAHPVPVFHVAEHDTASALAFAEPDDGQLLVSSGSWSLAGLSLSAPVLTDEAFAAGLTNERGAGDSTLLLRNLAGLWLLVECSRQWSHEAGRMLDPVDLVRQAIARPELATPVFDVGDGRLLAPGDMPERIARLCTEAGQPAPDGVLGTVRSIVESLAVAYAESVDVLAAATGLGVRSVRIVGGGSRNDLLCRRTAELTGLPVVAGPAEASAFGNLAVQFVAAGEFASLAEVYAAGGEAGGEIARYEPSAARLKGSPA
ncbi:FGGY-family carbohydrate kinase [Herbiconiux sp. YIM B11900]|uniref:rhamnulokinase n=1 Tax=Herbiconiux sp. YIM B11900 TaxID=3404131 RepID=UPI003F862D5A